MIGALHGKRIVNTRAIHQAEALNVLLRAKGAVPLAYPSIAILPPTDLGRLDAALVDLVAGQFDWFVLTSANTAYVIAARLNTLGLSLKPPSFRTAVIGPATAEAAQAQLGLESYALPTEYAAESLASNLPIESGSRILLPESAIARPLLADMLSARGAAVCAVDAYQTVCNYDGASLAPLLRQQQIDALTFTSSSTVTCFVERLRQETDQWEATFALPTVCLGSKTASTARECGFTRLAVTTDNTLTGLINTLDEYLTNYNDE